jgi:hypothetical protein
MRKLDNVFLPTDLGSGRIDIPVNWRLVESSNVDRVGWDKSGNMYVMFHGGGTYAYLGVSRQRAVAAAYAASVGRYLHRKIKGKFSSIKLKVVS